VLIFLAEVYYRDKLFYSRTLCDFKSILEHVYTKAFYHNTECLYCSTVNLYSQV